VAAVEGGALRLLEQLSRAAAGSDAGRAAVAGQALFLLNSMGQAALGRLLLSLLAHSPPEAAASFIATQAKHSAAEHCDSLVPSSREGRKAGHPHVLTRTAWDPLQSVLASHVQPNGPAAAAAYAGDEAAVQRCSMLTAAAWAWLPVFAIVRDPSHGDILRSREGLRLPLVVTMATMRAAQLAANTSIAVEAAAPAQAAVDWRAMLLRTRAADFGCNMLLAAVCPSSWHTLVSGACAAAAVLQRELRAAVGGEGAGLDAAAAVWAVEMLRSFELDNLRAFLRRTDIAAEEQPRFQHACGAVKALAALRVRLATGAGWGPAAEQELQRVVRAGRRLSGREPVDASALLPPSRVLGVLRRCGNPACANLAGRSEAELPLPFSCSRCGAVAYCSTACRAAHGVAGHTAACGLRGAAGSTA
jgi:hypothetical protein